MIDGEEAHLSKYLFEGPMGRLVEVGVSVQRAVQKRQPLAGRAAAALFQWQELRLEPDVNQLLLPGPALLQRFAAQSRGNLCRGGQSRQLLHQRPVARPTRMGSRLR